MIIEFTEEERQLLIAALGALASRRHDQCYELRARGSKDAGEGAREESLKCDRLMDKVRQAP